MVNLFIKIGFPILSFVILAFSIRHKYQITKEERALTSLHKLVTKYENKKLSLADIPKKQVDQFGYACLANALMIENPKVPKYNADEINQYITTHEFNTLDSLIQYIQSLKDDVDKLYAIFSYTAHNIKYDAKSFFADDLKYSTFEETFKKKVAVCSGYSDFYLEIAKRVNLNEKRIHIRDYICFAKGYGYDEINLPKSENGDHAIVYVEIDEVPFIIDATWGSGHITSEKVFEFKYKPQFFLMPFHKSLCIYYSNKVDKKILPYENSFNLFHKSCYIYLNEFDVKTESNPFKFLTCKNGHLELTYSCKGNNINVQINSFIQKSNEFVSNNIKNKFVIIENHLKNHPDRCRFKLIMDFPEKGFYEIDLYINDTFILTFFVNVFTKSFDIKEKVDFQKAGIIESILSKFSKEKPKYINFNLSSKTRFFPIQPDTVITKVKTGGTLIRFVASKNSENYWFIHKLPNLNASDFTNGESINTSIAKMIILEVPYDNRLKEYQIYINFPSNGFYSFSLYFINSSSSYKYLFDVKGVEESNKQSQFSPIDFLFEGRNFYPQEVYDENGNEILIEPNHNSFLVNKGEQKIKIKTNSIKDNVQLEFKLNGKSLSLPELDVIEDGFKQFKWSIPDKLGEYHLFGWVNNYYFLKIIYYNMNITLKKLTRNEKNNLAYMKKVIESNNKLNN